MPKNKPSAYTKHVARTAMEEVVKERRLKAKYPQMYKSGWGKVKKKPGLLKRLKRRLSPKKTVRTGAVSRGLKHAGVDYEKDKPTEGLRRRKK
jgi:hypothetical protein